MNQTHAEEFEAAVSKLEEAYREGLHAFCAWLVDAWHVGPDPEDTAREEAYHAGWNACLASLDGALDLFLEEQGH